MTQIEKISFAYNITKFSNDIDSIQKIIKSTLSSMENGELNAQELIEIHARLLDLCETNMALLKKIKQQE